MGGGGDDINPDSSDKDITSASHVKLIQSKKKANAWKAMVIYTCSYKTYVTQKLQETSFII